MYLAHMKSLSGVRTHSNASFEGVTAREMSRDVPLLSAKTRIGIRSAAVDPHTT